jgi:hypothetical protein
MAAGAALPGNLTRIITLLKGIREPAIRRRALAAALAEGDAETWADALAELLAHTMATDDADASAAVDALVHAVAAPHLPYPVRQALYEAARGRDHGPVARLFLDASPVDEADLLRRVGGERPIEPRGRALTLGERKALARTHRRDYIGLMLRDPHPDVVAILLGNPHLTEDDVVRMAALRPSLSASLSTIAIHPRWSQRYPVRRALVLNPSTPRHVAVRLATTLRPGDLAQLAGDTTQPLILRQHAAELLSAGRQRAARLS